MLTDGTHVVELYHLQNFLHHDGTLVAYLDPAANAVVVIDGTTVWAYRYRGA